MDMFLWCKNEGVTLSLSRWFCCFGCILVPHTFDTTRSYSTPIRAELWGKYSCWCCLVKRIFHICNERVYHHRFYVTWHTVPRIQTRILPCKMWSIVFFFQKVCQNPTPDFVRSFAVPFCCGLFFSKKSNSRSMPKLGHHWGHMSWAQPIFPNPTFPQKTNGFFCAVKKNCGSPAFFGVEFQTLPVFLLGKIDIGTGDNFPINSRKKQRVLSVLSTTPYALIHFTQFFCPNVSDTQKKTHGDGDLQT